MLFTRQPIVETIITPKEGFQLQLKSSSNSTTERYSADVLELVIYGFTPFYRSLEGPRPFLVPAGQFEVEQVRESRVLLKHAAYERKAGRELAPRENKKHLAASRERPNISREEKTEEANNTNDSWERRKHSRKRVNSQVASEPSASSSKSSTKSSGRNKEQTPSDTEDYEAFRYDLVPPPETFVSESMENLQKNREKSQKLQKEEKDVSAFRPDTTPLDAVEAILQASDREIDPPNDPPIG